VDSREHFEKCFRKHGGREMFTTAFTSSAIDPNENYEVFEQIGDAIIGKFLVQYAYMRFPKLRNTKGPGVVARIKIKYGSKMFLSRLAEQLQLDTFIRCSHHEMMSKKQDLFDDIFESFVGCLEHFLSERCGLGLGKGHEIVFLILKFIFDNQDLSLRYEDLYDPKTRLKQLFDEFKNELGPRPNYSDFASSDSSFDSKSSVRKATLASTQPLPRPCKLTRIRGRQKTVQSNGPPEEQRPPSRMQQSGKTDSTKTKDLANGNVVNQLKSRKRADEMQGR